LEVEGGGTCPIAGDATGGVEYGIGLSISVSAFLRIKRVHKV